MLTLSRKHSALYYRLTVFPTLQRQNQSTFCSNTKKEKKKNWHYFKMKIPKGETTLQPILSFPVSFRLPLSFFFLSVIKLLLWIEKSSSKTDCPSHQGLKNKTLIKRGVQSYQPSRQLVRPETQVLFALHNTRIKRQRMWVSCESQPIMYKSRANVPVSRKSRPIE